MKYTNMCSESFTLGPHPVHSWNDKHAFLLFKSLRYFLPHLIDACVNKAGQQEV